MKKLFILALVLTLALSVAAPLTSMADKANNTFI